MRIPSVSSAFFICFSLFGQLPETQIWLIKLKKEKDAVFLGKASVLTNNKGYNNQPSFSLDNRTLFYVCADSNQQTDIYACQLPSAKIKKITQTQLSEYSPQEHKPGKLHAVVVEKDSTQKIHEIEIATGIHSSVLEPDSVGYYCFLNADSLVYYKLTQPHSLRLYTLNSQNESWLGNYPTRGFKPYNPYCLYYCLKDSLQTDLYQYNFRLQKATLLSSYSSASEDLFWHPTLGLLRSEDRVILQFQRASGKWTPLFDLSSFGLKRITRFTIDKELHYLVVVNNL